MHFHLPATFRIIAVSYEARAKGVGRNINGDAAKKQCPEIILFQVPMKRGKADLTKYREAGAEVIKSISKFTSKIERASIDEAYIDATDKPENACNICLEKANIVIDLDAMESIYEKSKIASQSPPYSLPLTEIVGEINAFEQLCDGVKLKNALCLAQRIKDQILLDTGFRCSVGVAPNRMLAKISCSLNKPDKITVVPLEAVQHLMNFTKVNKVPGLGGKLGADLIHRYGLEFIGNLVDKPLSRLIEDYGDKTGNWLHELCRGKDYQAVSVRTLVKSIACSKNFIGKAALRTDVDILHWLTVLAGELTERIALDRAKHNRIPTALALGVRCEHMDYRSKSLQPSILSSISPRIQESEETDAGEENIAKKIAEIAFAVIKNLAGSVPINNISLSVGKFKSDQSGTYGDVKKLFSEQQAKQLLEANEKTETKEIQNNSTDTEGSLSVKRESFFRKFIEKDEEPAEKRESFFHRYIEQPVEEPVPSTSKSPNFFIQHDSAVDTILCQECGLQIPVHIMPEHSDFHFARKLQAEWNKELNQQQSTQNRSAPPPSNVSNRGGKRTRGRGAKTKNESRNPKIDAFFVKKN